MSTVELKKVKLIEEKEGKYNPAFIAGSTDELNPKHTNGVNSSVTNSKDGTIEEGRPGNQTDDDEDERELGRYEQWVLNTQNYVYTGYENSSTGLWRGIGLVFLALYLGAFIWSMVYNFDDEGAHRLLGMTVFIAFCVAVHFLFDFYGDNIWHSLSKVNDFFETRLWKNVLKWIFYGIFIAALVLYVIIDVALKDPNNLVSITGIVFQILLLYITSYNPARVRWRPVIWGLLLQLIFALIILRTKVGFDVFDWIGDRVTEFLEHTDAGSQFIFSSGNNEYLQHIFAFKVLPIIVFFSTVTSILYYLGVLQVVIKGVAAIMQFFMGTTAAESLNAAGNIFIGQTEAPLLIRPFISEMTNSELHAVMTGGFATIAGSVLAIYINFGVPANHLISASVMSAPAALAISKLFYPETQKSKTTSEDIKNLEKTNDVNIIQAASRGASESISLIANIVVNLIAFLALLHFFDATLTWFGHRAGLRKPDYPELTFELICSYLFWPLALLMGATWYDCRNVGRLIGVKTFLNEFVAYAKLSELIKNREYYENATKFFPNVTLVKGFDDWVVPQLNKTLTFGFMDERSEVISTYALCGFANLGSIGIMLGALGVMAPNRKSDLARTVVRAMIAGNVACFLTACIAGLLYEKF